MQEQRRSAEKKTILFIHYGEAWLRGSEICLLNLMATLPASFSAILYTNNLLLAQKATELGMTTYCEHFSILLGWQKPRFNIKAYFAQIKRTQQLIKKHNIALIHVNSGAPNQWAVVAAYLLKIPMLTQLHCDYPLRDRASLLFHLSPCIITVSKAISRQLLEEGFAHDRLHVVHNGVSIPTKNKPSFSIHTKLSISRDQKVLISIGSLIERKGFDRLIQAVKTLHEQKQKIHLVIVGEGPARAGLEKQIQALNLHNFVHLVGEQTDVTSWLTSGCDFFISGTRSEAFGLVFVEAALAGLPCIAPNLGGIPEIIEHNVTGLLYDSDKANTAIPNAINTLLASPEQAKRLAHQAKIRAYDFSLNANVERIDAIYQQILSAPCIVQQKRLTQFLAAIKALLRPVAFFIKTRSARFFHFKRESLQ